MIVTFSNLCGSQPWPIIERLASSVSRKNYSGNIYASETWSTKSRSRFTLRTHDSRAKGSRRSAAGRHMPHASWEAHYDVMLALFQYDPNATLRTAIATYRGLDDFMQRAPSTAHHNVGSRMSPCTIRETTVL